MPPHPDRDSAELTRAALRRVATWLDRQPSGVTPTQAEWIAVALRDTAMFRATVDSVRDAWTSLANRLEGRP